MEIPFTSVRHFGADLVSGYRREPVPAASKRAVVILFFFSPMTGFSGISLISEITTVGRFVRETEEGRREDSTPVRVTDFIASESGDIDLRMPDARKNAAPIVATYEKYPHFRALKFPEILSCNELET